MAVRKNTGWEKVGGRNYQVTRSGRVTDQQLRRSKQRVKQMGGLTSSDMGTASRTVYPPHPTARQLNSWEKKRGRGVDIRGIDAPKSSVVTARRNVGIPVAVQRQIGVRSNSPKARRSLSYGETAAITDEWEEYKRRTGRRDASAASAFIDSISDVYPEPDLQDEIFALISVLEE